VAAKPKSSRSVPERVLNLFTEVHAGEGRQVLLLALNIFLLLTSYYVIKPVREALILADEGAEAKSYLVGGIAVLLVFLVPAYARLVDRFGRTRLIALVTGFFIACMIAFWALGHAHVRHIGFAFFIWVGVFNVMIVAQFWSFANDVYANETGKRLFPIVAAGASIGAFAGSYVSKALLEVVPVFETLWVSAGLLAVCILLTWMVSRRRGRAAEEPPAGEAPPGRDAADGAPPPARRSLGFDLLLRHRYLGLIALLVLVLNLVNTNGEFILGKLAARHGETQTGLAVAAALQSQEGPAAEEGLIGPFAVVAARFLQTHQELVFEDRNAGPASDPDAQQSFQRSVVGAFYADFFLWVNLLGVALQLFLVGRLVKYGGVRAALLMLPVIALGSYGLIAALPVLAYARFGKVVENATDYSVNNTVRHMLFLPTSREIKYKAQQATDSFMQRLGDVVSAGLVFVGTHVLVLGTVGFAAVNLGLVVLWLGLALSIARWHRRIEAGQVPEIQDEPQAVPA
jgi:AAA family ATP:ADP antiporter